MVERGVFERVGEEVSKVDEERGVGATAFERLTATAFTVFARERPRLDLAVVEVGMGGLTDATNVVDGERTLLSVITPIELDHQRFLGETVEKIARVKSGIIKRGVGVVLAGQAHKEVESVVRKVGEEMQAEVWMAGEGVVVEEGEQPNAEDEIPQPPLVALPLSPLSTHPPTSLPPSTSLQVRLPLPGSYQLSNSATALLAAQLLRTSARTLSLLPSLSQITDTSMIAGIEATRWPGRLDWLALPGHPRRRLLVDGAHNPSSAEVLAAYLTSLPTSISPTTLILGLSFPRDPTSILSPLLASPSRITKIVCTPFEQPGSMPWIRATSEEEIASKAREWGVEVECVRSVGQAIERLEQGEKAVVAGSLYLAADVYRWVRAREGAL